MCAIVGIYSKNSHPITLDTLKRMTDSLCHRGPDGEGHFIDSHLGLGHRRLAIIDLSSAAHQPMPTPDGRYIITYNGEIYNFKELKIQLEDLGHTFHSHSDTEVLLKAYAEWGSDCLNKLNGMFAFAIWDTQEKILFLARDRYGIKPLYYFHNGSQFIFASEIKAIIASQHYRPEVDKEALIEYLTFQNFFTDKTLFKNIKLLPAGHFMWLGQTKELSIKPYWDFNFSHESSKNQAELRDDIDRLFTQAVSRQLMSDVPVNSYLSGGTDSASITLLASREMRDMKTFTVGFDLSSASGLELAFDERQAAEHISYLAGTEHYEMVLKAGDMERCMSNLVWHLEEPRVGQSYPNFYAAKLASKFGKVVLSGAGGDELFAGYPWRYYCAYEPDNFEHYIDQYYHYWQRLIPNSILQKVCRPISSDFKNIYTRDIFKNVFKNHGNLSKKEDYLNHSLYFEAKTFLHSLLVVEDKLSMAHGLESRVPFLDNDLVNLAEQVPIAFKLANLGILERIDENNPNKKIFQKHSGGKRILRDVMSRYVPTSISDRNKQGFSAPDASWFKGESIDFVKRTLLNKNAEIYQFLDFSEIKKLLDEHLTGASNRRLLIWSLLYLEQWLNIFIGSGASEVAKTMVKTGIEI